MEQAFAEGQEEAAVRELEELGGDKTGKGPKLSRLMKVQVYLPLKEIILIDELRIKLMKQGQDLTRSRLISAALRLLAKEGVDRKIGVKG